MQKPYVILIRTKPNVNGNCRELLIHETDNGRIVTTLSGSGASPNIGFQVTPHEFNQWESIRKAQQTK